MKTIKFTNIHIENFGKHSEAVGGKAISRKLGHRTIISGSNATGKSTIKRAIQYILGTKDENGKEISGIRPHDENGVDIDGLTTIVELGISVDGLENTLKRICFQEKNRQGEYTEKDNLQYFVDDVKKSTRKAYDEFVSSFLPNMVCISAQELLMKDTAGRRAMLEVFSKHDIDSVIDENPNFEPLRAKLKANTVIDLKKACRDKIKVKTKERDTYPARINEVEKQKVDIDLAELELLKNSLNEQITDVKAKQEDISKEFEEQQKTSDGILELKMKLNELQQKANESLDNKRREIRRELDDLDRQIKETNYQIQLNKHDIQAAEDSIKRNTSQIQICRQKWSALDSQVKVEQGRVFDEKSLICSYCGQEYPVEKKERLRAEFETHKEEEIKYLENEQKAVTARGNELKAAIDKDKAEIEQLNAMLAENEKVLSKMVDEVKGYEEQLDKLPQSIDISDRPEVQEIQRKIAEKEQAMNKGNGAEKIRQKLREEYEDLQRQLNEVQKQFDKAEENNRIDERIEELRQKQRDLSQEIADVEKELDLLKQFERKKTELLESDINSNFNAIQWHMSKKMQNGDLADICSPFVNGTSYDGNLNFSDKLLAEIDICRAFQKLYDIQAPVLLDNCESISNNRLPNVANQLIMFRVPSIPEKPFVPYAITEEEEQKIKEQWQEEKKKFEEYYSELRIECLED